MAINYSLVKLASKFGDKAGVPKFYARAQMNESISLKKFAKLIAMQTTVSYADVTAVIMHMVVAQHLHRITVIAAATAAMHHYHIDISHRHPSEPHEATCR